MGGLLLRFRVDDLRTGLAVDEAWMKHCKVTSTQCNAIAAPSYK